MAKKQTEQQRLLAQFAESPALFRENLIIDSDGQPSRFGARMDGW